MKEQIRIGFICDTHLTESSTSPQAVCLQLAIGQMKRDKVDVVVNLGDIAGFGAVEAWEYYYGAVRDFEHYEVMGNADFRDPLTEEKIRGYQKEVSFPAGSRRCIGVHITDGKLSDQERERILQAKAGDIVFMHFYIDSMLEESRNWITEAVKKVPLILVHGHGHTYREYTVGNSRVYQLRALDPDKATGGFPSVCYLDVTEEEVKVIQKEIIPVCADSIRDAGRFLGISCADPRTDVDYALKHGIRYLEIRCDSEEQAEDETLIALLREWKEKTGGYLSLHMPELIRKDGEITGCPLWFRALEYALEIQADGLTAHPPGVKCREMKSGGEVWNRFLDLYVQAASALPASVRMGIENLHMNYGEKDDGERGFGCSPVEIASWIDAVNHRIGEERVGFVLDVGHARNNDVLEDRYPISRWYDMMGRRTVAYHLHQVITTPEGYVNHNPIVDWFGPLINFTSFFLHWERRTLNRVPAFLEVGGSENYEKSIRAFERLCGSPVLPGTKSGRQS